ADLVTGVQTCALPISNVILQTRRQKTCLIAALARLIGAVRRHASNRTLARVADNGNSCPASTLFRPTSRASAFSEIAREIGADEIGRASCREGGGEWG